MKRSTERVAHAGPVLDAREAARLGEWLATYFGAAAEAAGAALGRSSADPGGAVRLPGFADSRTLDRLAGPAVFDMLLDRVDLPASAMFLLDDETSTFDLRPGRVDDRDDVELGDGLDEARGRRRPRTAEGFCDTLAMQRQLQAGSVRGLQVRDAWCWLPHLRPIAFALDEALCWHARLDLLLLPPGASLDCAISQPDHVLLVQVFGRTSVQFTDAKPEFDERRDGRTGLMPRKPPLRGIRWTAEPGEITHGNMNRAIGFSLRTAPPTNDAAHFRANADVDLVGHGEEAHEEVDDGAGNIRMPATNTSGWSGLLCVNFKSAWVEWRGEALPTVRQPAPGRSATASSRSRGRWVSFCRRSKWLRI